MLTEIAIEDIGVYRLPNMWRHQRIRVIRGENQHLATLAFGLGITIKQFKKLPRDKQDEVHQAFCQLTAPSSTPRMKAA
ncbi:hypothetical protein DEM27_27075 [Metarhizobium album]|uniref:Uncharacterized protein n=1 Tax=Metarhizobium album TaxID=2182425 RepID=A0A2U2DI98_9HYPH|nr:hypothetical protein [Rhizobium album]PWE53043.1 hypothetical protein DEM27_27075 [Rhizobium album]